MMKPKFLVCSELKVYNSDTKKFVDTGISTSECKAYMKGEK